MPQRRRTAVSAVLAASFVASGLFLTGCEIEIPPGSVPVPVSIAPVPSASAGQPEYVCSAVQAILLEGAVRLAEYATGDSAEAREGMQKTFADMAGKITAAGAQATDAAQRTAVDEIVADLTRASTDADPQAFLKGDFVTIGQKLDGTCT